MGIRCSTNRIHHYYNWIWFCYDDMMNILKLMVIARIIIILIIRSYLIFIHEQLFVILLSLWFCDIYQCHLYHLKEYNNYPYYHRYHFTIIMITMIIILIMIITSRYLKWKRNMHDGGQLFWMNKTRIIHLAKILHAFISWQRLVTNRTAIGLRNNGIWTSRTVKLSEISFLLSWKYEGLLYVNVTMQLHMLLLFTQYVLLMLLLGWFLE